MSIGRLHDQTQPGDPCYLAGQSFALENVPQAMACNVDLFKIMPGDDLVLILRSKFAEITAPAPNAYD